MDWYYVIGKEQKGPVNDQKFNTLCSSGVIADDTLVWNKTFTDWQPFSEIKPSEAPPAIDLPGSGQAAAAQSSAGEKQCTSCGRAFADDELVAYQDALICAACKPAFLQKLREGVATGRMVYAGFWIRFAAKFIDGLIMGVVNFIAGFAIGLIMAPLTGDAASAAPAIISGFLNWGLGIFYATWFVGRSGATPGKMVCGLKVVTPENTKVSYLRAFGRCFAEILSSIILGIGYIMAAFDTEKRTLHDRICSTRVIRKS